MSETGVTTDQTEALDRVAEIAAQLLALGVPPDAVEPIRDWLSARRAVSDPTRATTERGRS